MTPSPEAVERLLELVEGKRHPEGWGIDWKNTAQELAMFLRESRQEVEDYKRQSECTYCQDHHFNVTVCSKCAFRSTEAHRQADRLREAESRASSAEKELSSLRAGLEAIKATTWKDYEGDGGPIDESPRVKGLLMYVGTVNDIARKALTKEG